MRSLLPFLLALGFVLLGSCEPTVLLWRGCLAVEPGAIPAEIVRACR